MGHLGWMEDRLSQERIGLNQSTFRTANEKIEATAEAIGLLDPVPFICECADPSCIEIVRLTLDEYEEVRQSPRCFFNAPGHEALALHARAGIVAAKHDDYVVVEKINAAGEVAEKTYKELGIPASSDLPEADD
jgi:hypothetical protein